MKRIDIIGGGLAGLTLGIGLRRLDIPVRVFEAGQYPRHRVCGEFISGRGRAVLEELGLRPLLEKAGAFEARTVRFFAGNHHSPVRHLPEPALCLSRYKLDALLASEFERTGGELVLNTRYPPQPGAEGVVNASGRRLRAAEPARWFGVKVHARNVPLSADLEMHVCRSGYIGANRIDSGEINVCGLLQARPGDTTRSKIHWLRGDKGTALQERLRGAELREETFCAVGGISLKAHAARDERDCCIGDAITMIPPVTGNGMSMAFESAKVAVQPLADYARGAMNWDTARSEVARRCDAAFARRLAWARVLQWLMVSDRLSGALGVWLLNSEWFWKLMFARTR
ncbi:MAG TPA: hypothetical protein GYA07_11755 [Verrucomicrobia bacterium]|nr:hypothetical protein [Verrucomicrobiota bacterium]HOB33233.1 hypothetical protein [Verrucomicrobiota bacterium]HOP97752.1 hypothetical protein [Verrucomicrobiota bacterium]HPU57170.1 hypothetical protein [Verrucomicrobiota bacterium]